ncbi:MAG: AAA family ATPase, partial [Actinomycetota bacterium]
MTTNCPTTDDRGLDDIPGCWRDVHDALAAGIDRLILYGPPGTGKTFAGLTMGDVSAGSFRLICTEDMTAADVTGHFLPTSHGLWTWSEGSVLRAWAGDGRRGGRVVADEIDRASG